MTTTDALSDFLASLSLTGSGPAPMSTFHGPSQYSPRGRIFGAQILSQSVVAASRTVPADRPIHSMHGYFHRPGRLEVPVQYEVERTNDGRSFSSRRTVASQEGTVIFSMQSSFQREATGLEHQPRMPSGLPDPESLPTLAQIVDGFEEPLHRWWAHGRPFDIRHVGQPVYVDPADDGLNHQSVWLRATGRLPDDPLIHRAALAHVSDYAIFDPIYRRHGLTHDDSTLRPASLDHAIWWHRFGRIDEWILLDLVSPAANSGRGLTFGHMYSRDGGLLASIAQQVMVRLPR